MSHSISAVSASDWDAQNRPAVKVDSILHALGAFSLVACTALLALIYFTPAFVSDEIAFFVWSATELEAARHLGLGAPVFRYNGAGYGAAYWTLYINLIDLFGRSAIWVMRSLTFLASASIPVAFAVVGNRVRNQFGWLLALLWFSMPIAWWCGKVTGPETLATAVLVHGNLLLFLAAGYDASRSDNRSYTRAAGYFLVGFAVGLKVTMMPAAIFAVLVCYLSAPRAKLLDLRSLLGFAFQSGWPMAAGFVLCNPFVLFNFPEFVHQLHAEPGTSVNWQTAQAAISNNAWGWDGVFAGGLLQWSPAAAAIIILSIALLLGHWQAFSGLALSFLACWGMITYKGALLGWYWFGWIPLIVVAILWAARGEKARPWLAWLTVLAIVINATTNVGSIAERITMKAQHFRALEELPQLQQAIVTATRGRTYDLIIDYAEVSHAGGLQFDRSAARELIQTSPPAVAYLSPGWPQCAVAHTQEMHDRAARAITADAFLRLCRLGERGTEGKNTLIIVSKRLASKHQFANVAKYLADNVIPRSPPGTTFVCLGDLPSTIAFEITTPPSADAAQAAGTPSGR